MVVHFLVLRHWARRMEKVPLSTACLLPLEVAPPFVFLQGWERTNKHTCDFAFHPRQQMIGRGCYLTQDGPIVPCL